MSATLRALTFEEMSNQPSEPGTPFSDAERTSLIEADFDPYGLPPEQGLEFPASIALTLADLEEVQASSANELSAILNPDWTNFPPTQPVFPKENV